MSTRDLKQTTAILAHAAWFDASSWSAVAKDLRQAGLKTVAVQLPLTSFSDDVQAVRRVLNKQAGPVVLVGHSYGGAVITAAGSGDSRVKSLVYISAIVPDEGETVGDVFTREAPHPNAPKLQPDEDGYMWVDAAAFRDAIAPDSAATDGGESLYTIQKPISVKCLGEKMSRPAWKEKPSWFMVTEKDRMVSPTSQRFQAERMGSKVVTISTDHVPLLSRAGAVAQLVVDAASA